MISESSKRTTTAVILLGLVIISLMLIKPILLSIATGLLLAFIFYPVYKFLRKGIKSEDFAAFIVCILTIIIIVLPLWFLTPLVVQQTFDFISTTQDIDLVSVVEFILPPQIAASETITNEIGIALQGFISKISGYLLNSVADLLINFPTIFLQVLVVLFIFFFALRDGEKLILYLKSLLPFSREVENKIFNQTKNITKSVIYGQIIIGIIQGIIVSISFFIFGVPNALFLSLLATIAGVLPIVGPALIWIPVDIFLLVAGNDIAFFGIAIFGIFASVIDNFLRPYIVYKQTKVPSSVVLIGMIGGLFMFGVLGLILGPLILAYLIIVLELYRDKEKSIFDSK